MPAGCCFSLLLARLVTRLERLEKPMLCVGVLNAVCSSRYEWLAGRLAAAISQPMAGSRCAQSRHVVPAAPMGGCHHAPSYVRRHIVTHTRLAASWRGLSRPQVATGRRATLLRVSHCEQGDVFPSVSPARQPPPCRGAALARCRSGSGFGGGGEANGN